MKAVALDLARTFAENVKQRWAERRRPDLYVSQQWVRNAERRSHAPDQEGNGWN